MYVHCVCTVCKLSTWKKEWAFLITHNKLTISYKMCLRHDWYFKLISRQQYHQSTKIASCKCEMFLEHFHHSGIYIIYSTGYKIKQKIQCSTQNMLKFSLQKHTAHKFTSKLNYFWCHKKKGLLHPVKLLPTADSFSVAATMTRERECITVMRN
jgi:hypothetical protein